MLNTVAILIFCFLVLEDVVLKHIVTVVLKPVGQVSVIDNFFYLTYVENKGMAFGLLSGGRWLFILFTVVVLAVIFVFFVRSRTVYTPPVVKIAVILIAAGAVGNLIDRIRLGYVVDYLHFVFFGHSFAVFNFADILVTCGTALLCIYII
ncbi:MAG: signal peptidase II, partial [Clostridiales bacterium]|nr:signal peptidase II [Clostridiales bacterium]